MTTATTSAGAVDVLIVGGGIGGLSAAFALARDGLRSTWRRARSWPSRTAGCSPGTSPPAPARIKTAGRGPSSRGR
ncbi:FAD-binding protein [Microbispora hainanensis]|uniref:FAD-binding protein n=1 Tax=Microbispora hainanensis TaxID=568844 RepID=UPI001ABF8B10